MNLETTLHEWKEARKEFKEALKRFGKRVTAIFLHIFRAGRVTLDKLKDETLL